MSVKAVVVDDDQKVVMLVEKALKDLGFEVETATDGTTAVELIQKTRPRLVISDILLPGIHGVELCQMVKSDPLTQNTKVILMTAVYKETDYKLSMDCNADAFIQKPFGVKEIANVVGQVQDWSSEPE